LDKIENVDVRFDVQDKTIYASSVILSKRSEYFQKFFEGGWAESQVENLGLNLDIESSKTSQSTSPKTPQSTSPKSPQSNLSKTLQSNLQSTSLKSPPNISYHIKITDFEAPTFYEMIRFLYTNQIRFNHLENLKISPLQVFCIADKYLLFELRQKARCEVLRELNVDNVAEGLFSIAYKWPELKDPFVEFFVENFSNVKQTSGFDAILTNPTAYPGFKDLFKEILTMIATKT
jgi:hypothetical protein